MEQQIRNFRNVIGRDGWSKLTDGLLAALMLYLMWLLAGLAIRPLEQRFGLPGLLVYAFGLLAVAMFALQHAIFQRHAEPIRALYGITSGLLAWSVMAVAAYLGAPLLANVGSIILLVMVSLILMLLWRGALPLGMKFFGITLLANWAEYVLMQGQAWLSRLSPIFSLSYRLTGYLALFGILLAVGYILSYTRRRIQRVSAALFIWLFASLAMYVFWGPLY